MRIGLKSVSVGALAVLILSSGWFFRGGAAKQPEMAEAAVVAVGEGWGTLRGQIVFEGELPALSPLVRQGQADARDSAICAAQDVPDDTLTIDAQTRGVANVYIYLRQNPTKVHPDLAQPKEKEVVFDQKGCRFLPHCLAMRVDQTVLLKSSDAISHNTNIQGGPFGAINQMIPPGSEAIAFQFRKGGRVPIPVACNIHPWMKAWILPLEHPYFAVSDPAGKFTIPQLPAGEWEFRLWQERVGYVNSPDGRTIKGILKVSIKPDETTEVNLVLNAKSLGAAQ